MTMSMSRRGLLLGTSAALAATGACSRPRAAAGPRKLDGVTVLTGAGVFGREGAPYVARAMGYFRDAGIDVKVLPGAAGDYNLTALRNGGAQFAAIDYSGGVIRAGQRTFDDFRMIALLNPRIIMGIVSLPGRGIVVPADLVGKTIVEASGSVIGRLFKLYADLAHIDAAQVTWKDSAPDQLPRLLAAGNGVQAAGIPVVSAPAVAAAASTTEHPVLPRDVKVLPYADVINSYGNVLVTTSHLANSNPDLVRRFSVAYLQGLDYMVVNPADSARMLHQAVSTIDPNTAAEEMTLLRLYTATDSNGGVSTGKFDPSKVAQTVALLYGLRPLGMDRSPRPEDFIAASAL